MIWVISVIVVVVLFFVVNKIINKDHKVDPIEIDPIEVEALEIIEKELISKMEQLMFYDMNSRESIEQLTKHIFILCLKKSNKNSSFDEIRSADFLAKNPSLSLSYTGLYKSLLETIILTGKVSKRFQVSDKYQTAKNTLNEVMDSIISRINKI